MWSGTVTETDYRNKNQFDRIKSIYGHFAQKHKKLFCLPKKIFLKHFLCVFESLAISKQKAILTCLVVCKF